MCILLLLSEMFYRCMLGLKGFYCCSSVLFLSNLLYSCSIIENGMLKFPVIVELSISPFSSVRFCLTTFYIFHCVFFMLCHSKVFLFYLITNSVFKYVLFNINIATPVFIWLLFMWCISLHSLTFNLFVSWNKKYISSIFSGT